MRGSSPRAASRPGSRWKARREVHEEAGLTALDFIGPAAVLARQNFKRTYWQTSHYFLFRTEQERGEILDAAHHHGFGWFPLDALPQMFWPDEARLLAERGAEFAERVLRAAGGPAA